MTTTTLTRFAFAAVLATLAATAALGQSGAKTVTPRDKPVVFEPPAVGAPSERVGAGTRDATIDPSGVLMVLVPEGGGLTTMEKPPLIWRMKEGFDGVIQAQIGPVSGGGVLQRQTGRFPPGFYGLDLQRSDLSLETGVIYRWRVTLIDEATDKIMAEAAGDASPAAAGLWYDALAPFVSIDLSGRARVTDPERYGELAASAGLAE